MSEKEKNEMREGWASGKIGKRDLRASTATDSKSDPSYPGIRLACSLSVLPSVLPLNPTTVFFPFFFLI